MYNTYQNRLGTARKSMQDAGIEFDNAIRQAQLSNDETLAQNALKALQDKLNIALEGFNYKSDQENNRLNWNNTINNNYYNRYKDVESQINYENETAEKIRQYNENMAYQKEQQRLEQQRWEQQMAYQREQDAIANAQKWASINASYSSGGSSLSDGGSLNDGGNSSSSSSSSSNNNLIKSKYNSCPALSSKKANNWSNSNIFTSNTIKNGISESELERKISAGLKNKSITKKDADKILTWFGL